MKGIPDGSVDMILCDLPYGTTPLIWDKMLPFEVLWAEYERIIKPNAAIVLFGQEPFSSRLRLSNLSMFKYDWYWKKSRPSGFTNAKLKPLKDIETISVFSKGSTANGSLSNMPYNPQGLVRVDKEWSRPRKYLSGELTPSRESHKLDRVLEYSNYPRQILEFANPNKNVLHPTQKPVELCEYLIKTYTNTGDVVHDNTMGSGTTGVAAVKLGRSFIGIEKESKYFEIAQRRINAI
jgi:site-specific DNA-methyltransferase (adenine-specific)